MKQTEMQPRAYRALTVRSWCEFLVQQETNNKGMSYNYL
jgi:hypothetical protein